MSRTPRHGVFYTPKQNAILWEMEKIHRAAHDRSDNEYFWKYTQEELQELDRLTAEYQEEARKNA